MPQYIPRQGEPQDEGAKTDTEEGHMMVSE